MMDRKIRAKLTEITNKVNDFYFDDTQLHDINERLKDVLDTIYYNIVCYTPRTKHIHRWKISGYSPSGYGYKCKYCGKHKLTQKPIRS